MRFSGTKTINELWCSGTFPLKGNAESNSKWNVVASRVALEMKKWNAESNMFSDAIFESGRNIG